MRDFTIEVQSQDGSKTYNLDLYGDVDINVVYNIVDIREPESKKTNHTKEISIPATRTNNEVFAGINQLGFGITRFDPNFKLRATLYRDDEQLIDGYLQILEVVKSQNVIEEYKIVLYGDIFTFFSDIDGYNLNDLDLSEYNHQYSKSNIVNTWDGSIGKGYVYPMEWRGKTTEDYEVEDFLPAIYVKEYLDKIFELSDMEYTSNFLNSDYFKRMIIPHTKDRLYLTEEERQELEFTAKRTSDYRIFDYSMSQIGRSYTKAVQFNDEADAGNQFSPNYYYRPTKKSEMTLAADLDLKLRYRIRPGIADGVYSVATLQAPISVEVSIVKRVGSSTNTIVVGSEEYTFFTAEDSITVIGGVGTLELDLSTNTVIDTIVEPGERYWINIKINLPNYSNSYFFNSLGQSVGGDVELEVLSTSEFLNTAGDYLLEGNQVYMNQLLPEDVTCEEFITSINKLFNLYWVPVDDKTIRIEPRDNLYAGDDVEVLDWGDKVDRNEDMTITPLSELNNNKYIFSYNEDSDYYNQKVMNLNSGKVYGNREVRVLNDFVQNTFTLDTIFSTSPLVNLNNTDMVTPAIVELGDGGYFERYDSPNIRIHYWGGKKTTNDGWTFKSSFNTDEEQIYYPYAGHLDDPDNPTEDLLWDMPNQLYFDWTTYTQKNLFFKYWETTMVDITSAESHLLTCKMYHNQYDITNLNLFDRILIDGVYYVINKIEYNPLTMISDVELFKKNIFLTEEEQSKTKDVYKDYPQKTGDEEVKDNIDPYNWRDKLKDLEDRKEEKEPSLWSRRPILTRDGVGTWLGREEKKKVTNVHRNYGSLQENKERFIDVRGRENTIGKTAYSVEVRGDNNTVASSTRNIQIMGDNNTVTAGLENVVIVGSNQVATRSNTTIVNGVEISDNLTFNYDVNYYNGSINETQKQFGNQNDVTNIVCGIDAVQNLDTSSPINYIDCGVDRVGNVPNESDI